MRQELLGLGLIIITACGGDSTPAETPEPTAPEAAEGAPEAADKDEQTRIAKVVETMDADSYTYAKLDHCGQEAWVAGPKTELTPGMVVTMPMGTGMQGFESASLGRTFDVILFVDWFRPAAESDLDCDAIAAEVAEKVGPHGSFKPDSTAEGGKGFPKPKLAGTILETMQSGGYTYVHLDSCEGKTWVAGPKVQLEKGQHLAIRDGSVMNNFTAPSLGRTFESIWFVSSIAITAKPPSCD